MRQSYSVAAVMRTLGYRASGGMHRYIVGLIHTLELDTSHFRGQGWNKGQRTGPKPKRSLEEILVASSTYPAGRLRQRLIAAGLKPAHCEGCGLSIWRGRALPLHLDHVNGNHTDNRLENLRVLCPNCHSQTDTWCHRNRQPSDRIA